MKIENVYSLL